MVCSCHAPYAHQLPHQRARPRVDQLLAQTGFQTTDTPYSRSDVIRAALKVARNHEAEVLKVLKERL